MSTMPMGAESGVTVEKLPPVEWATAGRSSVGAKAIAASCTTVRAPEAAKAKRHARGLRTGKTLRRSSSVTKPMGM